MNEEMIAEIEKTIDYVFNDKALLTRAFTHSSTSKNPEVNNETLEFLGDSILNFVIAKTLMLQSPTQDEGMLSRERADVVSQTPLQKAVYEMGLGQYLIVGKGERAEHLTKHSKAASSLFEAILGAIYLDAREIAPCEKLVLYALKDPIAAAEHPVEHDFKSMLNEYGTKHRCSVKYVMTGETGEPHAPVFSMQVLINDEVKGEGKGGTKKSAEQRAAKAALEAVGAKL